jgi:signal transduction histidine kinase
MTTGAAEQLATEADRGRAALLAAVSHDLRAPLAAAKAAVSGLRSRDARLTADDREELLATAEESLDLLAHLAASLLDVSRLQAGTLAVFPRPADLGEIVADSLDALGPQARTVLADSGSSGRPATRSTSPGSRVGPRSDCRRARGVCPPRRRGDARVAGIMGCYPIHHRGAARSVV